MPAPTISRLLARLHEVRATFAAGASAEKRALVTALARRRIRAPKLLLRLHDDLLFLRAFADDELVRAAALGVLAGFASRVRALAASSRRQLDDTGIAETSSRYGFPAGITAWLVQSGEHARIDWPRTPHLERVDVLLRLTLVPAEFDAFDSSERTTREWLRLASGSASPRELGPLVAPLRQRQRATLPRAVARQIFDAAEIPIVWTLRGARSTTHNALSDLVPVPREGMRKLPGDPRALIATALPVVRVARRTALGSSLSRDGWTLLSPAVAERWIDASRAALSARCREVDAITYANPRETYLVDLGSGTSLCLIGVAADERLTLEANYGYVLFANGVPVGYGGVTPLAAQANTGVNIFDAFRGSEAAVLFAQTLRAFRSLFRLTRFLVNPYQFGAGNDEALASGAYWLYDRLGFRPTDPGVAAVADGERARLSRDRRYRSSVRTLGRLATSDLALTLPGHGSTPLFAERWLVTVGEGVTRYLSSRQPSDRQLEAAQVAREVRELLGGRGRRSLAASEQAGYERLAPVVALILDDVAHWPSGDRRTLDAMLRAKGGAQERDFALRSRDHARFWGALRAYGRRG